MRGEIVCITTSGIWCNSSCFVELFLRCVPFLLLATCGRFHQVAPRFSSPSPRSSSCTLPGKVTSPSHCHSSKLIPPPIQHGERLNQSQQLLNRVMVSSSRLRSVSLRFPTWYFDRLRFGHHATGNDGTALGVRITGRGSTVEYASVERYHLGERNAFTVTFSPPFSLVPSP